MAFWWTPGIKGLKRYDNVIVFQKEFLKIEIKIYAKKDTLKFK